MGLLSWLFGFPKRKPRRPRPPHRAPDQGHTLAEMEMVGDQASNLARIVDESIRIARESRNPDTVASRISIARQRLDDLKQMVRDYPFLILETLDEVEVSLQDLEHDIEQREDEPRVQSDARAPARFANEPRTYHISAVKEARHVDDAEAARDGDRLWIPPGASTSIA